MRDSAALAPPQPLRFKTARAGPHRPLKNQPLKALPAQDPPETAAHRSFLTSHAKSGPFLGPAVSRAKYWKKPLLPSSCPWPPDESGALSEEEADLELALSRAQTRFSEISVADRRQKIRDLLRTICQTRPLIESRAGFRSHSSGHSAIDRRVNGSQTRARPKNASNRSMLASAPTEYASRPLRGNNSQIAFGRSPSTPSLVGVSREKPPPRVRRQRSSSHLSTITSLASDPPQSPIRQVTSQSVQVEPEDLADLAASVTISPPPSVQREDHPFTTNDQMDDSSAITDALPVVRGVSVDYVHANIDGAAVMGHHKRAQSSASSAQTTSFSSHRPGMVPKYLKHRQKEWDEEAMRVRKELEDADIPKDHKVLTESDRHETLKRLNDRYEEVIMDLNRLPVSSDTMRIRARRKVLEEELNSLDEAIKTYSRPRVFVLDK